jgi:hypothetical protein
MTRRGLDDHGAIAEHIMILAIQQNRFAVSEALEEFRVRHAASCRPRGEGGPGTSPRSFMVKSKAAFMSGDISAFGVCAHEPLPPIASSCDRRMAKRSLRCAGLSAPAR